MNLISFRGWAAAVACLLPFVADAAPDGEGVDQTLAAAVDLDTLLRLALAKNPELEAADGATEAARLEARATSPLPEPRLRLQWWNAPLDRPLKPEMWMVGLEQDFPALGSLGARAEAARHGAGVAESLRHIQTEELATRVRKAFAEYRRAFRTAAIRADHVTVVRRSVDQARLRHSAARGSQQDALAASVELARAEAELAVARAAVRSATLMLNTLLARDPLARMGEPAEPRFAFRPEELAALADGKTAPEGEGGPRRPEIAAARASVERADALADASAREARWPSLMLGIDYMRGTATDAMDAMNGFGAMFSMSLPWLWGRSSRLESASRAMSAAERGQERVALLEERLAILDGAARVQAARVSLAAFDASIVPLAQRSLTSSEGGFAAGSLSIGAILDAQRAWLSSSLEREEARYRLLIAEADLLRALGRASQSSMP